MKNLYRKKKIDNYEGSSEHLQKEQSINKMINTRLKIFIAALVFLAFVLIYRLYTIQIVDADHYADLLEKSHIPNVGMSTMRGEFLDRNGNVLVSNKSVNSITYYPLKGSNSKKRWEIANAFVEDFEIEDDLKEVDLKNLWLMLNDDGKDLITEEENTAYSKGELKSKDIEYL